MKIKDLIIKSRSYRRFNQTELNYNFLKELVDLARLSPSGGNIQPLRYMISNDMETNAKIFPSTMWAGYLKDWIGPAEGERPMGYIIILHDKEVAKSAGCDYGIAAQSIALGAAEKGIGACMIGSIKRVELSKQLNIPERYNIMLIIALGVPSEKIVLDVVDDSNCNIKLTDKIKYFRDSEDIHHVPKLKLNSVIIK